ncbi:MAG: hypothetical protein ACTSVV_07455 [Promethearchaeota archaeon]
MSEENTKIITVNVKDLSFKGENVIVDLIRFIAEQIPQADIKREGNQISIEIPEKISKRAIKLRIKKFLYRKHLDADYRPISYRTADEDGYIIKEKKAIELSYY